MLGEHIAGASHKDHVDTRPQGPQGPGTSMKSFMSILLVGPCWTERENTFA